MHSSELELALTFVQAHPDAAARELELQPPEITAGLMNTLPLPQGRDVMKQLLPTYAARVCAQLSVDRAVGLLVGSSVNQVASILRCLPKINRQSVGEGAAGKNRRALSADAELFRRYCGCLDDRRYCDVAC